MENDPDFQKLLRLNTLMEPRVPLAHNFYEELIGINGRRLDDTSSTASTSVSTTPAQENATAKLVKDLMNTNKQVIEKAAMQQAASAVNVNTQQFPGMIPLSFDQEQFIRDVEAKGRR